jgi:lysophospholipase L1-like esterase
MRQIGNACAAFAAALCLAGAAYPAQAAHTTAATHTVLHYGDSLAVGTGLFLPHYLRGWTLHQQTSISLHADEGSRALASSVLPHVIVISLGTNDDPGAVTSFARSVREVIRAAGPERCVIWSTVVRPPYNGVSYDGYNWVLRRDARIHASFHVFDWQALARANPRWFGSDGVHPTMTGYRARAAALARLIKACPA